MKAIIISLYQASRASLDDAIEAFENEDAEKAQTVLDRQEEIDGQVREAYLHQEHRFLGTDVDRLEVFRIEMKLVEKLRRVYSLTKRIARAVMLEDRK